ncbi:hypothetical protein [Luteimonas suaedae]|uniref:hypothetical protein n=1 Tax=Luteimonas suaedae TaxID=2605430 RepID=UPI0011EE8BC9|nr:hypothetical protein [Luteimonas suaedae]
MKSSAVVLAIALVLAMSACASPQAAATGPSRAVAQDTEFLNWVVSLGDAAERDPKYRRIPLDTPPQVNAFTERLHRLYRGQDGEAEFRTWVDAEYPGHRYEQDFIIQYLALQGHGGH